MLLTFRLGANAVQCSVYATNHAETPKRELPHLPYTL